MSGTKKIKARTQFKRDLKTLKKRGKNKEKLATLVVKIANGETLPPKNRVHKLTGTYEGKLECHIGPDWLLIYSVSEDELLLERTGSHSDLF